MKLIIKSFFVIVLALLINNCGESKTSGATNKYLGEAPGFAQTYKEKISNIEKEAKEAKSMADLAEYDEKRKELKKESKEKLDQIAKSLNLPKDVPFEGILEDEKHKINNLQITNVMYNQIELSAEITSKVTRSHIFGYLQAIDANGNPLESNEDWVVLDVSQWRNVKEGESAIMKGYYRGIEKLENLEKFVFKTREDYEKTNK